MLYYLLTNSMYEAESYTVNEASLASSLIIATQGSEFKEAITKKIVEYYQPKPVYLEVIDISRLYEVEPRKHSAILIMHTWEYGSAPEDVKVFLRKNSAFKSKIIVVTTSSDGDAHIKGIDAITGESNPTNTDSLLTVITGRMNPLLEDHKLPEQVLQ